MFLFEYLLGEDWHKLFECRGSNAQTRPSVIKVRRLLNLISKLKNSTPNGIGPKPVTFLSDTEDSREIHHNSEDDRSDDDEFSGKKDLWNFIVFQVESDRFYVSMNIGNQIFSSKFHH